MIDDEMPKRVNISAVDVFCGAGALSYGLIKEGIRVNAGIDLDPACEFPFERNNKSKFLLEDVGKLSGFEVATMFPVGDIKVLVGCAPCQPFSTYTQGKRGKKWGLLNQFSRIVREAQPEIVSMENVPQLVKRKAFVSFVESLEQSGYKVSHDVVKCEYYGVPQTRRRLVLLASKFGPIQLLPPTHSRSSFRTVSRVIRRFEKLDAGDKSLRDPLHTASALSNKNMRRILASVPGGTWRDWKVRLRANCHRRKKGKTFPGVYGRMKWEELAPTITTQCHGFGNGRFGHPEQNRAISLREAASLQTFPQSYKFVRRRADVTFATVGRLIGNAVPVRLARVIGRSILRHVEAHIG